MKKERFEFEFELYDSIDELPEADALLLKQARAVTVHAYAPYSKFHVGAAARFTNGEFVTGTNQENASYPVGICAERTLLSAASSIHPDLGLEVMAVTYNSQLVPSDHPVAPCGICRQSLQEMEARFHQPLRLIMGGMNGQVIVLPSATHLLPFSFSKDDLH